MPVPCAPSHLECSSDVHRILCMHAVLSVLSVEETWIEGGGVCQCTRGGTRNASAGCVLSHLRHGCWGLGIMPGHVFNKLGKQQLPSA